MNFVQTEKNSVQKHFLQLIITNSTVMEQLLDGVKNYNIAVKKRGDDITFLRRIVPGGADDSYGIEVAKLAGIPQSVISRAKEILKDLEHGKYKNENANIQKQDNSDDNAAFTYRFG